MATRERHGKRGRLAIPTKAHPLVRRLYEQANSRRMLICEIAAASGVPEGTLDKWRRAHQPQIANIEAALNVVGLRLTVTEEQR